MNRRNDCPHPAVFCAAVLVSIILCTPAAGGEALPGLPHSFSVDGAIPSTVWEIVSPPGFSDYTVVDIEAANQNTAYAIVSKSPGTVLKTTNYGSSWTAIDLIAADNQTFGWTEQISVVNANTVWAGSVHSPGIGVAITTNGGGSWAYNGAVSYQYALEATSASDAWVGGYFPGGGGGWVYQTHTGGGSDEGDWIHEIASGGACMDIESFNATSAWAVCNGGWHGHPYHWNGTVWEDRTPAENNLPELNGVWAVNDKIAWAVGGSTILRTTDGGATWSSFTAPDGSGSLNEISALSAQTALAAGALGTIIRTTNGGTTWEKMYCPTSENIRSVYFMDTAHALAAGEHGTVLRLVPANTRAGSGVTVNLGYGDSVTFASVSTPGNTLRALSPVYPYADNFTSIGETIDIATNAVYTGPVTVRKSYDDGYLGGMNESLLRLAHNSSGTWQDITTGLDTDNNIVTGATPSLSEFGIIYPVAYTTAIVPNYGVRGTIVNARLTGSGYWGPPTVQLKTYNNTGEEIITATNIASTADGLSCRFTIPASAKTGFWNLEVTNPDQYGNILWSGFTVFADPPITLTTPNGGNTWKQGSPYQIRWTYNGYVGSTVKIELLNGAVVNRVITPATPVGTAGAGSYTWTVPFNQATGSNYRIRITTSHSSAYTDSSNGPFTIAAGIPVTVTVPNGGQNWSRGSAQTIRWNYTGSGGFVKIDLLKAGTLNRIIAANTSIGSGGLGSKTWTVPFNQVTGTDYRIRVSRLSNLLLNDSSNANFTISAGPPITVTNPNGGNTWKRGSSQTIRWTYTGNPGSRVKIDLMKAGILNTVINASTTIGSGGTGSYLWTIPAGQVPGTDYRVRITSTTSPACTDQSNTNFAIST